MHTIIKYGNFILVLPNYHEYAAKYFWYKTPRNLTTSVVTLLKSQERQAHCWNVTWFNHLQRIAIDRQVDLGQVLFFVRAWGRSTVTFPSLLKFSMRFRHVRSYVRLSVKVHHGLAPLFQCTQSGFFRIFITVWFCVLKLKTSVGTFKKLLAKFSR